MHTAESGGARHGPYPIRFEAVLARASACARSSPGRRSDRTPPSTPPSAAGRRLREAREPQPDQLLQGAQRLSVMTPSPRRSATGAWSPPRAGTRLGLAWAGRLLGAECDLRRSATIQRRRGAARPRGRAYEEGRDYDEAVLVADRLVRERGMRLVTRRTIRSSSPGRHADARDPRDQPASTPVLGVGAVRRRSAP